jgi:iron complex transport system substrate-binding protein
MSCLPAPRSRAHSPAGLPRRALRRALLWALVRAGMALLAASAVLGAGPVQAQAVPLSTPLVVRDDRGVEHRFAAPPQRIVSLMPSLTETVGALGGAARLVGVDRYSAWPPEVARLPRLGALEDAQIEAIARLKPDVVLASTAARSLDRMDALGFKVVRLQSDTHADLRRTLGLVATLLGTPEAGEAAWVALQSRIDAAAARVPAAMRGQRVYFELGGGPWAAGGGSFIGETLARLGLQNIVPPELGPFPKLNPEFVVRARPQVILGTQREQAALLARPGWQAVPAVAQRQVCGFDSAAYDVLVRPGPRLGEAADLLADCLVRLASRPSVRPDSTIHTTEIRP